jgi:AraC family transcriptional regulator
MDDVIETAVERVIRSMHNNLGEVITIDDMARTAMFSKFHFTRIFQRVTGISPGRFLSALRLQEAKRLLLTSSMTVADISHVVGYNSIGTFSSRFRASVGVSPTEYRQYRGYVGPLDDPEPGAAARGTMVRGRVSDPGARMPDHVLVGAFRDRIAQGVPVRHTTLRGPGSFVLEDVPEGTWHIQAHSVEPGFEQPDPELACLASYGPVTVRRDVPVLGVDLRLRGRRIFDPPPLLAQVDQPMWTAQAWAPGRADRAALPGA